MTEPQLDDRSAEPLHFQLQRIFVHKITSGEWPSGHQLEGEVAFSNRYGVSRSTVRQAILALVNQEYLTRKQGKGTFVARPKHEVGVSELRFSALENSEHRLLDVRPGSDLPKAAAELGWPQPEQLTVIERLRLVNGEPVALEVSTLPSTLCPGIEEADFALPLVDILRREHGIVIARYSATVEPVLLGADEQKRLEYDDSPALGLLISRIGFSSHEEPVVFSKSTFRGDRCRAIFNH